MARRKHNRDEEWVFAVAKVVGFLLLLGFVFAPSRQGTITSGILLLSVLAGAILVVVGGVLWKSVGGEPTMGGFSALVQVPNAAPVRSSVHIASRPAAQLIDKIRGVDWFQFEKVIETIYRKLGYDVLRRGGANPDGGIDIIIEKNGETIALQCKHWRSWNVGVKAIREFLGALTDAGIPQGIFITLRGYTGEAKQLADKHGIRILSETDLVQLLKEADAEFDPGLVAALNETRKFCPKCESEMVLRTANKGPGVGRKFWGCSTYPRCRFTLQINS